MSNEDINLQEIIERLDLHLKPECTKSEQKPNLTKKSSNDDPDCAFETLSLKADCPKGSCQCNNKKKERDCTLRRVQFKRPILRRSRLNSTLLRSPVLKLDDKNYEKNSTNTSSTNNVIADNVIHKNNNNLSVIPVLQLFNSSSSSCAVQARQQPHLTTSTTTQSDDTTMEELASYFDLMVHIPKKMSLMAEMMYT